jgi:hypothetical protein
MVMGDALSNRNGSSAFSSWEAVSTIKVAIWNKDPLMNFQACLRVEPHLYVSIAAFY